MRMKRRLLTLCFLWCCAIVCAAQIKMTDDLALTGTVDVVCELKITPLSKSAHEGMPFDLEGTDLTTQKGRRIAIWSLSYPGPRVRLQVAASPLKGVENPCELDYELLVEYSYGGKDSQKGVQSGVLVCNTKSDTSPGVLTFSVEEWERIEIRSPIFFRLIDAADIQNLPPGEYKTAVVFDIYAM